MNENWCIFCISIIKNMSVEQAFARWEDNKDNRDTYTAADVEDMIRMRKQGMTYKAIGEIYGISDSAVCKRISYKRKNRSATTETANKEISYSY